MMRNLNWEPAGGEVYLSSPPPASVKPGYHKIWECAKRNAPTAPFWGRGEACEIVEKMKGKLLYCPAGLPQNNDGVTEYW